ncbi:MAG: hypothetical protein QNJ34_28245 [Xenococcaceae cyanobacterium MO_188.B29]|nr:hypothetical protein [Xenococcaceae cyanobacterium MO_188.B29]
MVSRQLGLKNRVKDYWDTVIITNYQLR